MKVDDRLLNIIQDHARVCDTLDAICCSIENGTAMPNFIPVCCDTLLTDQLSKIVEAINKPLVYEDGKEAEKEAQ